METSGKQKTDLRRELRSLLKGLSAGERQELDQKLAVQVLSLPEIKSADTVYAYASLPWESGTDEILSALWQSGKRVALPRVCKDEMAFYEVKSFDDLFEGAYHIREPKETCPPAKNPAAPVLVPGMAFTKDGLRLGKGGGYYDRFLKAEPQHNTIALAYEFQIVETIPTEPHDKGVCMVVTERMIREDLIC